MAMVMRKPCVAHSQTSWSIGYEALRNRYRPLIAPLTFRAKATGVSQQVLQGKPVAT